jgi:hypothetical protein
MPERDLRDRPAPEPINFRRPYAEPPAEVAPDGATPEATPAGPDLSGPAILSSGPALSGSAFPVPAAPEATAPSSMPPRVDIAPHLPPPAVMPPPRPPRAATPTQTPDQNRSVGPRVSTLHALGAQLRSQWQQWRSRAQTSADAARRGLATEVNQDVDYVKLRARHYHERQPLQAVGMVAASAFAVGMIFGFWRR